MKEDNLGFFAGLFLALFISVLTVTVAFTLIKVATSKRNLPVKQYDFSNTHAAFMEKKK